MSNTKKEPKKIVVPGGVWTPLETKPGWALHYGPGPGDPTGMGDRRATLGAGGGGEKIRNGGYLMPDAAAMVQNRE